MNDIYSKKLTFNKDTKNIIDILQSKTLDDISKLFKTSDTVSKKTKSYYENLSLCLGDEAINIYNGLCFRNIDYKSLDNSSKKFINENILILSALYGPISPNNLIAPYRLDFTVSLKIKNKTLKSYMKKIFDKKICSYKIYNLASDEFSNLINTDKNEVINFQFLNNEKKEVSANLKKLRGHLTKHIAENKSFDSEVFKSFSYLGYKYSNDSTYTNIIYRR